jgi:hypothetical protein
VPRKASIIVIRAVATVTIRVAAVTIGVPAVTIRVAAVTIGVAAVTIRVAAATKRVAAATKRVAEVTIGVPALAIRVAAVTISAVIAAGAIVVRLGVRRAGGKHKHREDAKDRFHVSPPFFEGPAFQREADKAAQIGKRRHSSAAWAPNGYRTVDLSQAERH